MSFKLYEICGLLQEAVDAAIERVDQETGEVPPDWSEFLDTVQLQRDIKALDIARWIKSMEYETEAIRAEERKLEARRHAIENRSERVREWLSRWLTPGEKISDPNTAISWRKSTAVSIIDEKKIPQEYLKTTVAPMKSEIKKAISEGKQVDGAVIEERINLTIK